MATRWDVFASCRTCCCCSRGRPQSGIQPEPIRQPIFITGLPRSGTTFLHRLMMNDPDNRAPLVWETIYPSAGRRPARPARGARGPAVAAFERLAPEFRALHPLEATSPQECSEITAHVFRSLRFDTTYHIPSYRRWLDADGPAICRPTGSTDASCSICSTRPPAPAPRWVLKCPDHLFALDAIRAVYPDARLVFVHRDPVKVLLSVAQAHRGAAPAVHPPAGSGEIGRQESAALAGRRPGA